MRSNIIYLPLPLFFILAYNFSHRIDHLSFGELVPGIINPLDGTEKIAVDRKYLITALRIYMKESAPKTLIIICFYSWLCCEGSL